MLPACQRALTARAVAPSQRPCGGSGCHAPSPFPAAAATLDTVIGMLRAQLKSAKEEAESQRAHIGEAAGWLAAPKMRVGTSAAERLRSCDMRRPCFPPPLPLPLCHSACCLWALLNLLGW